MTAVRPEDAARYYAQGFWRDGDLWTAFAECAARAPDRVAFYCGEEQVTFDALVRRAAAFGQGLAKRGIGSGDVVVVHGRNGIEAVIAMLGCAWAGAVIAPLPPIFSAPQVAAVVGQTGARAVICLGTGPEIARAMEGAGAMSLIVTPDGVEPGATPFDALLAGPCERRAVSADALALLVYSSGTTGAPKGVMHSSNTLRYAIEARAGLHRVGPADTCIVVCQFGFVGSVVFGLLTGALIGCSTVILTAWDPARALELIARHRVGYGLFMPTHVHDLLHEPTLAVTDLTSFRRAAMGGLPRSRREEVMQDLCPMPLPGYGMSECLGNTTCTPDDPAEARLSREGRPYPGTELRIVRGGIELRGPSRCLGYYGSPAQNAAAFTEDGFFRSGDLGSLDAEGFLTYAGREKDIIRRGGVTIVPGEIEAVLARHPGIRHIAIVALPDPRHGEIACACVIPAPGAAPVLADLTGYLGDHGVARYQWPERLELFQEFPRTPSLKVKKPALVKALTDTADRKAERDGQL